MFKIALLSKQSLLRILTKFHLSKANFPYYGENLLLFFMILILSLNLNFSNLNSFEILFISLNIGI